MPRFVRMPWREERKRHAITRDEGPEEESVRQ